MTREQAEAIYFQGKEAVIDCLLQFAARLQHVEEQVAKNSNNSSKPPSSDGLSKETLKPMPQSLRKKTGKKPGAQPGHTGKTLLPVESPDQIVEHRPATCQKCDADLRNAPDVSYTRRQVFEMPKPKVIVTEHRAFTVTCSCCGKESSGAFPEEVKNPVQYGPNFLGLATYLHSVHLLPYHRCATIMRELTDCSFSCGSLHRALTVAAECLSHFDRKLQQTLSKTALLHADETGSRVAGKLHWVHVRCNQRLCRLFLHERRGGEAVRDLADYDGRLVSDFFSSYVRLSCSHQFCGAHLLRELTFAHAILKQPWAGSLKNILEQMVSSCHSVRASGETLAATGEELARQFDALVGEGLARNPLPETKPKGRGRPAKGKVRCLLERLRDYREQYLAFLFDLSLPFTNNEAERDIRMLKVKGKVSGCFRTVTGAEVFCRLRSYIVSCQKQGMALLECLRSVFAGSPILPALNPT